LQYKDYQGSRLFVKKAGDLPLPGKSLLKIMQAVLSKGIPFRFKARGWSMTPFIRDGDVITITPVANRSPGVGAVVAFSSPSAGHLVIHRIIAIRASCAILQGDNPADQSFEKVPLEKIFGKVIRVERNGRPVWLGIGFERWLIAFLSRTGLLSHFRILRTCHWKKMI
jgi:hypothetical protein